MRTLPCKGSYVDSTEIIACHERNIIWSWILMSLRRLRKEMGFVWKRKLRARGISLMSTLNYSLVTEIPYPD
jgi:hypothetical protein